MSKQRKESILYSMMQEGITISGKPAKDMHFKVIFVVQQDTMALRRVVDQISDPISPDYGNYLSMEEVQALTGVRETSKRVIDELSRSFGSAAVVPSSSGGYVHLTAPIIDIENYLNCTFFVLQSAIKSQMVRTFEYYIPAQLSDSVSTVLNTVQHPFTTPTSSSVITQQLTPAAITAFGFITPDTLKMSYHIDPPKGKPDQTVSQAVFSAPEQSFSSLDLFYFQRLFNLDVNPLSRIIDSPYSNDACTGDVSHCLESNLDVQYLTSTAEDIPTILWYEETNTPASFGLFLASVSESENPPTVISISYTIAEAVMTAGEIAMFDTEALQLSARGVTILAASGDYGVAGFNSLTFCGYNAMFPASSPYVTAVGATAGVEVGVSESACEGTSGVPITTGGGFSSVYPTPAWQKSAVNSYWSNILSDPKKKPFVRSRSILDPFLYFHNFPARTFNKSTRGYPDISLAGLNYIIVANSSLLVVSGTSCSTPVLAGMISLINKERVSLGKPRLGWMNPLLYSSPLKVAHDIKNGTNKCTSYGQCCSEGFFGAEGWDPVTGLGAADFTLLRSALLDPMGNMNASSHEVFAERYSTVDLFWLEVLFSLCVFVSLCCCLRCWRRHRRPSSSLGSTMSIGLTTYPSVYGQSERPQFILVKPAYGSIQNDDNL